MKHWHIRAFRNGSMVDDRRIEGPPKAYDYADPDAEIRVFTVDGYDDMVCFPPCARRLQTAMLEGRS